VTGAGQGLFAGTGAIGRYWQARCVGFEVRSVQGRRLGVVTRVGSHPGSGRVHALYVGKVHRADTIVIEPPLVVSVDPWQRLLIVEQPDEQAPPSEAPTVVEALPAVAARTAPVAWHRAVPAGVAVAQRAGGIARTAAPPAGRFGIWLGMRAAFAAAFLVWLYGAAVFLVTRVTARVLLVSAFALSAALRRAGPRLWRAARKLAGQAREFGARHSFSSR